MTSRRSDVRAHGRSRVLALGAAGLTTLVCHSLLVFPLTQVNVMIGIMLGGCISITLGVLSALRPPLLPALTAFPAILILFVTGAQLYLLHGVEYSPELRTGALVLIGWLVVAAAFYAMDRQAVAGHYRDAAQQSVVASVILFFVAIVISSYGSEAIFRESVLPDFLNRAYALGGQLCAVCFFTGVLAAPVVLMLRDRAERSRDQEPVSVHETVH